MQKLEGFMFVENTISEIPFLCTSVLQGLYTRDIIFIKLLSRQNYITSEQEVHEEEPFKVEVLKTTSY